MRVFNGFEHTAYIPRPVVTIGSYDGVHRGHREILSHLEALARARKGESVVVTFHPHPRLAAGEKDCGCLPRCQKNWNCSNRPASTT